MKSMNLIRVFTLAVISFFTVSALKAQDVQMVILQHGDNASAFYGTSAFVDAMKAAVKGDAITLSAGTFTSATIDKAVTIQGAGYVTDVAKGRFPSVLSGDVSISIPESDEGCNIEGVCFAKNVTVTSVVTSLCLNRSQFNYFTFNKANINCAFKHCKILVLKAIENSTNLCIQNTVVTGAVYSASTADVILITNCIIYGIHSSITASFRNSIIHGEPTAFDHSLNSSCSIYNTVFIGTSECGGGSVNQSGNYFTTETDLFGNNKDYKLTDASAAKYLGTDGKQVGIYGGDSPFTDVPSTPQITVKSIDSKVSNGKLNATIHVEAQK